MNELPFHLKTLEPLKGALDILRYFDEIDAETADADDIMNDLDLTDRSFSKAMRRLVTKGYVQMDGDMIYRLTDQGQNATEELIAYDDATGGPEAVKAAAEAAAEAARVTRRLVVSAPATLGSNQPSVVQVGFHASPETLDLDDPIELVVRTHVVNGLPDTPEDLLFSLEDDEAAQAMYVVPQNKSMVRLRFEVYQMGEMGDIENAGGMYVDLPVGASEAGGRTGYGADVTFSV